MHSILLKLENVFKQMELMRATSALPFVSKMVELDDYYEGRDYLGKLRIDKRRADNNIHINLSNMVVTEVVAYCFGKPMTYDYYHKVVKGKTPKTAATFSE